ncbi:MAG: hypothetical protein HY553_22410 [Elusimicrobia bacterium]|nr:hypothetical protein [Elusimicrobiota bacterium]
MTDRIIKSVISGFLGTYASRYSDRDGYWLFGFLVRDMARLEIDLRESQTVHVPAVPAGEASRLARLKFGEQIKKHGVVTSQLSEARLIIERSARSVKGEVNGRDVSGFDMKFSVSVRSAKGREFLGEKVIFVAPHDPDVEHRSTRDG